MKIKNLLKTPLKNPKLIRPKWYLSSSRSEKKIWLDKNENIDPILNMKIKKIINGLDKKYIYTLS